MATVEQQAWPYASQLREIRGPLSADKASRRVDVTRQTWAAWEAGQAPSHDNLRAIVEAFNVPPELVGYEPPKGYELVPAQWIVDAFQALEDRAEAAERDATRRHEEVMKLLGDTLNAVRAHA